MTTTATMTPSSALKTLQNLLTESVEDFKNHLNVNKFCEQLKNELFSIVETFLTPVIEEVLCDPELLPELKVGAGKMGLHFKRIPHYQHPIANGKHSPAPIPILCQSSTQKAAWAEIEKAEWQIRPTFRA